jgi:ferredoxin
VIIVADRDTCIGAGTCVNTVPDVFELDEEGLVRVLQPKLDPKLLAAVGDAVAMCPVEALSLSESS